ncbi:XdhC family protein [Naasia sp. SYSU D00948]|uniref:XdhC family protein n=1 Tax=Naasia sp. SYSU D00948 TaxID=2817379 RepID=UPI001B303316|nr:XdhC/CoxI family protein [Naasia sp. SYSU D00948]
MLEIAERLLTAAREGEPVAVVTVTEVLGSAPRDIGTSMALAGGHVLGSISGGCVEAAAVEACERVLDTGLAEVSRFGFGDDEALAVGLACGGELDVVVHIPDSACVRAELEEAARGRAAGIATVVGGPPALLGRSIAWGAGRGLAGEIADRELRDAGLEPARVRAAIDAQVATGVSKGVDLECDGTPLRLFVESALPAPRLLLFGAVEFAAALAAAGRALGYRVTVCDARPAFTTPERFPDAHEVVPEWPHLYLAGTPTDDRTVVCVLTHDDRFDLPLLREALSRPLAYIGALGSRRTAERRRSALLDLGLPEEAVARLHSPMGLDLGAATPAETAVSVLAEVLAVRTGGTGIALRETEGPIHRARTEAGAGL